MGECDGDNGDGDDNYDATADFKGNKRGVDEECRLGIRPEEASRWKESGSCHCSFLFPLCLAERAMLKG